MSKKIWSVHYVVSFIVFIAGFLNFLTSLSLHHMPHIQLFEGIIPLYFKHTARTFTLLTGIYLMILSLNLFRRKRRAWILSLLLIATSIFLQFVRGFNMPELLFLVCLLCILIATRHAFEIQSDRNRAVYSLVRFAWVLVILFVYSFFGFYLFQGQFSHYVTVQNIFADYLFSIAGIGQEVLAPLTRNALWFSDSISIVSVGMFLYSLMLLFEPLVEKNKITTEDEEKIRQLVLGEGDNSVNYFFLTEEKQYFIDKKKQAVLSYVIKNGYAVVLGDPVGVQPATCLEQFLFEMKKKDLKPVFFNTSEQFQPVYESLGFNSIKIGDEAVLSTNSFTLVGSVMADVRHEVTKMQREGAIYSWYPMDQIPWKYIDEINSLHESWTSLKKAPQLTFSLDFFPFPIEDKAYVLLVIGKNDRIWGALSFFPYNNRRSMALDFMIRSPHAPHGVIEAGISEAINFFKAQRVETVCLGMAPLSDVSIQENKGVTEKIKSIIFDRFNQFYQYKSLFKFKNKFNPQWRPKYLVFKNTVELPAVLMAVAQAHLKEPFTIANLFK